MLTDSVQLGFCPGPLPGPPFPASLRPLRPALVYYDGRPELAFTDSQGRRDTIENREALCDAAGCRCHGPSLTCGHTDGVFYERLFAQEYAGMCFHGCHCDIFPPEPGVMAAQRHGKPDVELQAATLGTKGCLKNKSSGWTLKQYASKACCPGTHFQAVAPQEAYVKYNVAPNPAVTIGVCTEDVASS
ncbi:MAG: hypothetical protein Q9219_003903 [cf. Caloplaca sp. 3 TL-2023]